jgi:hypothetical protein
MTTAIIDGKRYNTDTATKVAGWSNDHYRSDFEFCWEDLYITRKGNWFTEGGGGPLSKYSVPAFGGGVTGSSDVITPLTSNEARTWLEERDEIKALEEYFSDEIEDA